MNKKLVLWLLYTLCLLVTVWGGLNMGVTRFGLAIPFMVILVWLSRHITQSSFVFYISIIFVLLSVTFNLTIFKNPVVFPILKDGYLEVVKDGYLKIYSDGGVMFVEQPNNILQSETVKFETIKKGNRYRVTGISMSELNTRMGLNTEIGRFGDFDYRYNGPLKPNKIVYNRLFSFSFWLIKIIR